MGAKDNLGIDIPRVDIPGFDVRLTIQEDEVYLKEWLQDRSILDGFAMSTPQEIDDSVQRWISFHAWKCSLTGLMNGVPCAMATLYLMPYKKIMHQAEFGMIVGTGYRGKGIGTQMMRNLIYLAKKDFKLELLHLNVHEINAAVRMYRRLGFKEFGRQEKWAKIDGKYVARLLMEKEI